MNALRRTLLLVAGLAVLCLGRSPAPPRPTAARALRSAPGSPPTDKTPGSFYPARWKDAAWAADEMQVVAPDGRETALRVPPLDRAGFLARAAELEARPGVKQIRPVFYESPDALARRSAAGRLILTRQVAASLPEGAAAEEVAARHGARVLAKLDFLPRTWLFETAGAFDALEVAASLREREGLAFAAPQFARLRAKKRRLLPNDALFGSQWHLRNTGQNGGSIGEDLNVATAWDTVQGSGIVIGIVDDGLEYVHEDLAPNYSAGLSVDLNGGDADPAPLPGDNHGTACAGLAGARGNNSVGVAGCAPLASLAGIRLTAAPVTDAQEAQSAAHRNDAIHVKSNIWGPDDDGATLRGPDPLMAAALADAATNGRGGKGVVMFWAGGNGRQSPDNSNFDGYANNRHVIAVGAVNNDGVQAFYSERGANLFVCTPGGEGDVRTTDLGGYQTDFSGTSAATPMAAGVAALLLERNPALSARDVMHVFARTARRNDFFDGGWITNGGGFHVNHRYGFGVLDAAAGVDLAGRWPLVGPVSSRTASSPALSLPIADNSPGSPVTHTLSIAGTPFRIEHVEVDFSATHTFRGDLQVTLVAPSGTRSVLAEPRGDPAADFNAWTFMSRRHWGEMAVGDWTIEVADLFATDVGSFTGWTLRIFGTPVDATAPAAGLVNDGPGADLDLQVSASAVSANWSGFADPDSGLVFEWAIGTSPAGEQVAAFAPVGAATSASRTGLSLVGGTTYFVTVRATNFEGLSTTASSDGFMIDSLPPDAPGAPTVTPAFSSTGLFTVSWTAPADPGGSGVASYTVERSRNGAAFVPLGSSLTPLFLLDNANAFGPGSYTYRVAATDAAGNASAFSAASTASIFDATAPTLAVGAPGAGSPLPLSGTAADAVGVVAVTWINAATGQSGVATGPTPWSASIPLAPGFNSIAIFAWDAAGNAGMQVVDVPFTPADVLPPSITISIPTSADSTATGSSPLALGGGAFDDTGLASITWENLTTGTSGAATVGALWSASVPLLAGANTIRVTARDAAGNATSDAITVTLTPALDLTLPTVDITSPTSSATFPTGVSPLALGGTAGDASDIAFVRWQNAATGGAGMAAGTTAWTASIALAPGANAITVTAVDAAGNEETDTLTATFTPPGVDTIDPAVSITSPASPAFVSGPLVLIGGFAADDTAALEVVWSNATTGTSGTATGVGVWSAVVDLQAGANAITVTAYDADGNAGSALLTVTFSPPSSGGGGGGGCGLTGLEVVALALLLRAAQRLVRRGST